VHKDRLEESIQKITEGEKEENKSTDEGEYKLGLHDQVFVKDWRQMLVCAPF
jgi:hypothetical protein